ncbi:pre-peptidase C-terminal domain-containing protein [Planococcus shenhongbingii]|uniref:fibronectin type III domain-containing protein n=1 Tax=Planococcus shenhongbingii TaxID=3058398 RepID=UPI00261D4086|nr:pre-peptidase C-terminal domain-containing protein [Planococcus sp. N016]WKA57789.1 pre-peptidase C-terminal domain-containing protein [Planococcus sp. N016]
MKKIFYASFFVLILTLFLDNAVLAAETTITSGVAVTKKITANTTHTYQFSTNNDGETYITLDQTTGGFSMFLYDEQGKIVDYHYQITSGNTIIINKDIPKGTYFLKIEPYGWSGITSGTYRVKATYPSSFNRNITTFEPNDTNETSLPITSGNFYNSTAETKIDRDVYQFTATGDGEVYITLDQMAGGFSMHLYDANGDLVDYKYQGTTGNSIVLNANILKGNYYLMIDPYSWNKITSATYRVKATYPSSFTRNISTFEPNDTDETSMPIKSGDFYSSTATTNIDKDIYQFTANADGEVYITLDETTGGYSMHLYDANGDLVDHDYQSTSGNTIVLNANIIKGKFHLEVDPYSWSGIKSAAYRVKATYPSSFTRNTKSYEPNDTIETSMSMVSNQSYSSTSYSSIDQDVYKFTTDKSGTAAISLDNLTGGASLSLYDSNRTRLDTYYPSSIGNSIKFEKQLGKGTYYIKINPYYWSGLTNANYRLKATFADKTPTVDSIYDTGITLVGTAVSNTKVYAAVGSSKIGEATAKDGKYSMKIPKQKAGTKIGVYTIDLAGNRSSTKTMVVVSASVKAASAGYSKLKVSWAQLPGAQGYEVYRSTSSAGTFSKVGTITSGSTLSYTNSGLTAGKTYYYKVRAYRTISGKKVYYPYSNSGNAKPSLAAPSKISASKASATAIKTSWSKVSEAGGYELYRATSKSGTYTKVKTETSGSSIAFTDTGLVKGKTYYYKVRAYRIVDGKKVYSPYTTIVSGKL